MFDANDDTKGSYRRIEREVAETGRISLRSGGSVVPTLRLTRPLVREDGVFVSDRKVVKLYRLLRTHAWITHGGAVERSDLPGTLEDHGAVRGRRRGRGSLFRPQAARPQCSEPYASESRSR